MATSPPATVPTREQLDEIDTLLKRMLTLPPMPGEPAEQTLPSRLPDPALPAVTFPAPVIREVPPAQPPAPGDPVVQAWRVEWTPQPPAPASPPPVTAWGSPVTPPANPLPWAVETAAPPYAVPVPAGPQPAATPSIAAPIFPTPPALAAQAGSAPVRLLVVLNGAFNLLTYLLGPPGAWLRGSGRNMLGWAGLTMLVTAAVWAAGTWAGYEWPRPNWARLGR